MSDVQCPYCETHQEINHDDGHGYEEAVYHNQTCVSCEKEFKFTTEMSYSYTVECQDDDHVMKAFGDDHPGMYQCEKCDFYEKRDL